MAGAGARANTWPVHCGGGGRSALFVTSFRLIPSASLESRSIPNRLTLVRTEPTWHASVRLAANEASEDVRRQVERLLESKEWLKAGFAIAKLPEIWITDDGMLKFEWMLADRSLAFFFAQDERDSGWALATTAGSDISPEWGTLANIDAARLFGLIDS